MIWIIYLDNDEVVEACRYPAAALYDMVNVIHARPSYNLIDIPSDLSKEEEQGICNGRVFRFGVSAFFAVIVDSTQREIEFAMALARQIMTLHRLDK